MNITKDQIITLIENLDEDTLKIIKEEIEIRLSPEGKEDKFIELYNLAQNKLDSLIANQTECPYDIWEFFWNKLFNNGGFIDRAYKLVPFNTDIVDSSYQDEVFWIMNNWKDAVEFIKEERDKNNYFNNL